MSKQLQDWLNEEEYQKVLKFCGQKLAKNTKQPFYITMKAYCFLKLNKFVECKEALDEIKVAKQTEPHTIKYLVEIFTAFGDNDNAMLLLENVKN